MKKILLSVLVPLIPFGIYSQITINSTDIIDVGTSVIQIQDTVPDPTVVIGSAGANQNWDFSMLKDQLVDTLDFVAPSASPYGNDFPASNVAVEFDSALWGYFIKSSSALYQDGFEGYSSNLSSVIKADYNPNELFLKFPANYQDSYNDTSITDFKFDGSAFNVDSIRAKITVYKFFNIDAWGTVTTPVKSYNALRVYVKRREIDSIWAFDSFLFPSWSFVQAGSSTFYTYDWWTNDPSVGFPVVSLNYDTATSTVVSAIWLKDTTTVNFIVKNEFNERIKLYPNPANNYLFIENNFSKNMNVDILSIDGRKIKSITILPFKKEKLDISNLTSGVYIFKSFLNKNEFIGSNKFIKK